MVVNVGKSSEMRSGTSQKLITVPELNIENAYMKTVHSQELLGIHAGNNLRGNLQTDKNSSKASGNHYNGITVSLYPF